MRSSRQVKRKFSAKALTRANTFGEALIPGSNDIKSGLQDTAEWKSLSPKIPKQNVEEKDLKKAA